jgi:hypothetical protein
MSLSAASVGRLFSLPLQKLDLKTCRLLAGSDDSVNSGSQQCDNGLQELVWRARSNCELLPLIASHAQQLRKLDLGYSGVNLNRPSLSVGSVVSYDGVRRASAAAPDRAGSSSASDGRS